MTHGKIERRHKTLKNRFLLENYFLPGDLQARSRPSSPTTTAAATMRASTISPRPTSTSVAAPSCPVAARLLARAPNTIVLADKAYDADWLRRQIEAAGADGPSSLEALLQLDALQPHRARLRQDQTLPMPGHTLLKACRKLPRHAQPGCNAPLAPP
jgi:hypothetical protein